MLPLSRRILGPIGGLGLVLLLVSLGQRTPSEGTSKPVLQGAIPPALRLSSVSGAAKAGLVGSYGKLPLSFEANQGQSSKQVKFLTRGPGYTLFLTGTEAVLALTRRKSGRTDQEVELNERSIPSRPWLGTGEKEHLTNDLVRMRLVGASPAPELSGMNELPGRVNYFVGNDPKKWRANIPTYAKVRYRNVYPGIDLVYYGHQGQLEYDFVVAPGANPGLIKLSFEHSTGRQNIFSPLRIDRSGSAVLESGSSRVRLTRPVIYQSKARQSSNSDLAPSNAKLVDGGFVLTSSNQIRFKVDTYDKSQPLVIDPGLVYSTFLGGSSFVRGNSLAVDSSGNVFIAGLSSSPDFPTTPGVLEPKPPDPSASFYVTKINPTGSGLVYSTYFGASAANPIGGEGPPLVTVDSSDNVYLTGYTAATDFPVTPGAFQTKIGTLVGCNAFVTKLNSTGSALLYSTYLGGKGLDVGSGIAVDSSGNAYVTGLASSSNFPTTPSAFQVTYGGGGSDAFLSEITPDGSGLVFSTFLGGTEADYASGAPVIDSTGAIYVIGGTSSKNFPTKAPLQGTLKGATNAFVTKVAPGGSTLLYSTYLGGSGTDNAERGAVDSLGNIYIGGATTSTDFPTVSSFQAKCGNSTNCSNAFAVKINPAGSALLYSTYLGGSVADSGGVFAVDGAGNAYIAGTTFSPNFPVLNPIQATYNGGADCFITVLGSTGSTLAFSTYLGGSEREALCSGALDSTGHVYLAGTTNSVNYPVLPGAFQTSFSGPVSDGDAFLTKIDLSAAATPVASITPTSLTFQGATSGTQTVTVKNTGTSALSIAKIGFQVPSASFGETDDCTASAIAAGATCTIHVTFTPQASGNEPGLLSVSYSGTGSPQLIVLTVVDFSFTPSANSLTLNAGGAGSVNIPVRPLGGFSGNVNISCAGAPPQSACNPSPSIVNLDGLHGGTVTVSVTTAAPTQAYKRAPAFVRFYLATLLMLPLGLMAMPQASIRGRSSIWVALALILAMLTLLASCGGGGSSIGQQNPSSPGTPPGTYTLTVTGSSGNVSHTVPISLTVQ